MIRFVREKTKRTSQGNQVTISCYISDKVKTIIEKWGNEDLRPDAFLFPILLENDDVKTQTNKIGQFIQNTNKVDSGSKNAECFSPEHGIVLILLQVPDQQ